MAKLLDDAHVPITRVHHVCFVLFGIAQLLPWNVYLKCIPYVNTLVFDICGETGFGGLMMSTYNVVKFVTMVLIVFANVDGFLGITLGPRIALGMFGNVLLMLIVVITTIWPISSNPYFHYYWFLGVCSLAGFFTAFMMKGLVGMLARFPGKLTPFLQVGNAVAGLLVSCTYLLSSWLIPEASDSNSGGGALTAIFYFGTAIVFLSAALIAFLAMLWNDSSFRHYFGSSNEKIKKSIVDESTNIILSEKAPSVFTIINAIKWHCIAILMTLTLTISLATNLLTSPRSFPEGVTGGTFSKIYIPLVFLLYDLGDLAGKWIPLIMIPSFKSNHFLVQPFMRVFIFVPLFLFFAPTNAVSHLFQFAVADSFSFADLFYWFIVFSLGVSTGYLITCLLMTAPSRSTYNLANNDPSVRESSGVLMGMFLNIGLVTGSLSYILWSFILSK